MPTCHLSAYKQPPVTPKYMARRFKETFSRDVKVHFVGAWYISLSSTKNVRILMNTTPRDTVSSVGVIRDKTLPGTTDGMKHATYFRHALALDERRVKFLPEYAHEGTSLPSSPDAKEEELNDRHYSNILPHTKEVWFAGTHSDMWAIFHCTYSKVLTLITLLVVEGMSQM